MAKDKFLEYTENFTPVELEVMSILVSGLATKKGKNNAVTIDKMIKGIKARKGITITKTRIRKILSVIRKTGAVKNLLSSAKGFYVSNNKAELIEYVAELQYQIDALEEVKESLVKHNKFLK